MTHTTYKKRLLTIVLAFCLVLTVTIGITLAYLNDKTESRTNHLTFVNGDPKNHLTGLLEEVWNPDDGLNLLPGSEITKKPKITNNSSANVSEWAAMQVVFEKINGTTLTVMTPAELSAVLDVMDIDFNTTDWTKEAGVAANANGVRYYYNSEIAKGISTEYLFTKVNIKTAADNAKLAAIEAFSPDGINIRLEGAVVQSSGLTFVEAQTELNKLLLN